MNKDEVKNKIIEIFNSVRNNPEIEFKENNFMDFLLYPPKNNIKNSFRGARKYYCFMDKIELEFGMCFKISDLDRYYSVDELVEKVNERINKRKGNLIILKNRNEEKDKYILEIVLLIILMVVFYWQGINLISIILTICFSIIVFWTLSNRVYAKKQLKKMNKRLKGKQPLK